MSLFFLLLYSLTLLVLSLNKFSCLYDVNIVSSATIERKLFSLLQGIYVSDCWNTFSTGFRTR